MTALVLAMLLSQEPVRESGLITVGEPLIERPAITVKAGELVPFDGVCLTDGLAVRTGKRIAMCEATVAKAEEGFLFTKPVLLLGVAGIIAASFAAGVAVTYAATKSGPK